MELNIKFTLADYHSRLSFIIFAKDNNGRRLIGKPVKIEMEEVEPGMFHEPTFSIPIKSEVHRKEVFDSIINSLKYNHVEVGSEAAGELKATKYHLEDMRKLIMLE